MLIIHVSNELDNPAEWPYCNFLRRQSKRKEGSLSAKKLNQFFFIVYQEQNSGVILTPTEPNVFRVLFSIKNKKNMML